jgi:hypothetical protein
VLHIEVAFAMPFVVNPRSALRSASQSVPIYAVVIAVTEFLAVIVSYSFVIAIVLCLFLIAIVIDSFVMAVETDQRPVRCPQADKHMFQECGEWHAVAGDPADCSERPTRLLCYSQTSDHHC